MVSINRRVLYGEVYNDIRCLSTDEKPTEDVKNGSVLTEIDTGTRYLFDAVGREWHEVPSGGGGGTDITGLSNADMNDILGV